MEWEAGYWGLFFGCFLGATILPLATEAFVVGMLLGDFDAVWVVFLASLGNWLGGLTNYGLGRLADYRSLEKWTGVNREKLEKFKGRVEKYGGWAALVSWLPFVGDPLMVALGFFRANFSLVLLNSLVGKTIRYIVLAWITLQF